MEYIDLRNCLLEPTNLLCPACQRYLLQKILPNGIVTAPDFKYYLVCPNDECRFLGSPDVDEVPTIYKRLFAYDFKLLDFIAYPLTGFDPVNVTFDANSFGMEFEGYTWEFGDGSIVYTGQSQITHQYLLPGSYTVSVKVYDNIDHKYYSCSKINLINVNAYVSPTASFSVDDRVGDNRLEVQFTDNSTGSNIIQWEWDFGDGTRSYEQSPKHLYAYPGVYTVKLTIRNSKSQTSALSKPNYIIVNLTPPVAKFIQDTVAGYAPVTVTFTYTGVNEYVVDSFKWSFGDGTISNEQNPTHTYLTAGIYNVQLEVYNSKGSDAILKPNAVFVEAPKIVT